MEKEIGGYFELELSHKSSFPHSEGICLNSGRNALEYILKSISPISRLWIPYFTCEVILEPLHKLQIPYSFYLTNEKLELKDIIQLASNEYLLATNYFGIKDSYIRNLARIYKEQLIIDNAQAYFCPSIEGIKTIYSPRKFVGVPDGGIAMGVDTSQVGSLSVDCSYERCSHLLKRYDLGASGGYEDFRNNSHTLVNQPMRIMSNLTKALLSNVDYSSVKEKRLNNFKYLNNHLGDVNKLDIPSTNYFSCPMVYPYYTENSELRRRLIENKIFIATYWPNVIEWCKKVSLEYDLAEGILPLPVDQRYGLKEMDYILNVIQK